ncbi:hypothetical protein RUMCAL_00884 [Ruminococcus callidus ATCC 27760]|uniref:Uncharacterized protein n=2 Tax=Ruminococcus callidus TaxID=40519 RepID=U2KWT2_9FIRM|nr:hypothetical protein RUMCAL_00884 [Ruminococcus callidus ATCC 27760]
MKNAAVPVSGAVAFCLGNTAQSLCGVAFAYLQKVWYNRDEINQEEMPK